MEQTGNTQNSGEPSAPVAASTEGGSKTGSDMKGLLKQLEAFLDDCMIKKAPFQIPMNGKEILVKIAPYLVILGILMAVPVTLLALIVSPVAFFTGSGLYVVGMLFALAALVLEAIALPGLFKRTHSSWNMLFYASVVSVIGNLVSLNLVGAVIGAVIGWYILFQIKELYKN